jgi:hypothetical protein
MKRSMIAVSLALVAGMAFAATNEYRFDAGEQDGAVSIADAYRFNAGEQDGAVSIADAYRFNAGEQDESQPKG